MRSTDQLMATRSFAFDRLSAVAAVLDQSGAIVDTNEAWRLFAHLNDGSVQTTGPGVNYLEVCDRAGSGGEDGAVTVAAGLREILAGDVKHFDFEYPCPSPIEERWFMMQASSVPVVDGAGLVLFHVDITGRKLLEDRLIAEADHDELTGLPNRRSAVRIIEQQLSEAQITGRPLWVLFLDLNGFKAVNDTHGHHVGDEVLVKVAVRARRTLREGDLLSRLAGDEFVVACLDRNDEDVQAVAGRLRQVMSEPFQSGATEVSIGVAVGMASSSMFRTVDALLHAADSEMYLDKGHRRAYKSRERPRR